MPHTGVEMARTMHDSNGFGDRERGARTVVARLDVSLHEEWLLDEALKETFPASDPISPAEPAPSEGRTLQPTIGRRAPSA